jgi:hypothetical protein
LSTKAQRIAELERKLQEALAGQVYVYHFADSSIGKGSTDHLMASGVILTLTVLGGQELIPPTLIRDGLSHETVAALRADFRRCYALASAFKPKDA